MSSYALTKILALSSSGTCTGVLPGSHAPQYTQHLCRSFCQLRGCNAICSNEEEEEDQIPQGMPPKVVEVYKSVGKIMSRYSAGKVPKAFKIIPNLKNWEEVRANVLLLMVAFS